jgi:cation:H+ antiporter
MSLTQAVVIFAAAAGVVALAGVALARNGDELAERAGLSRLLVGMLLVATATSLPEVVIDISAAAGGAPDLAVGDLFGSSLANMAILAIIDLLRRHRVWPRVEVGHARVASVAIALTAMATLGVLTPPGVALGWVGIDAIVITGAYVAAIAWMRRSPISRFVEGGVLPVPTGWARPGKGELRPSITRFAAAAVVILVAGPVLAGAAEQIAEATGLGQTFVGSTLVALATSLPELVAAIAAVRIGAHDLAVGNLFGSNAFNMAALMVVDAAYRPGPLLTLVDASQAVAGIGAILVMAMALAAIVHGAETRVRRLEPDAILLLMAYAGALFAIWSVRP